MGVKVADNDFRCNKHVDTSNIERHAQTGRDNDKTCTYCGSPVVESNDPAVRMAQADSNPDNLPFDRLVALARKALQHGSRTVIVSGRSYTVDNAQYVNLVANCDARGGVDVKQVQRNRTRRSATLAALKVPSKDVRKFIQAVASI